MLHVLISNDDGVMAPGIRALAEAFLTDGWRVTVAAPGSERSAASHSITIKRPMVATAMRWDGTDDDAPLAVWALDGTPADCVKAALHVLTGERPQLVVSGINNGWNVGTDVHYSGTVGAAMEGAFEGVPGLAVSTGRMDTLMFRRAARMAVEVARRIVQSPLPPATIANLNLPDCPADDVRGLVEAPLTRIQYTDAYDRMERDERRLVLWLKGDIVKEGCDPQGDLAMLLDGFATLSILGWDLSQRGLAKNYLQDDR